LQERQAVFPSGRNDAEIHRRNSLSGLRAYREPE